MDITKQRYALRFLAEMRAETGLMIRSGQQGEFTDSAVETTGDHKLHINGYVWSSLLCRALRRCRNGRQLAEQWGRYEPEGIGVASLWTAATFLPEEEYLTAVNPGIRISRKWGTGEDGALYSDELAYPLTTLPLNVTAFFANKDEEEAAAKLLMDAIYIINQGIETIGGGWSYGFGRLQCRQAEWAILDLAKQEDRQKLWRQDFSGWQNSLDESQLAKIQPEIAEAKEWTSLTVQAEVADGQLLAIHSDTPPLGGMIKGDMPDSFVFSRPAMHENSPTAIPVITGKAFRQAIISREIERMLRSSDNQICLNTSDPKRKAEIPDPNRNRPCLCPRCQWFGDSDGGGIISVADTPVQAWESEIINRVQLCEHSMQNINLFNGEYLTQGRFTLRVIIDHSRPETNPLQLEETVQKILQDIKPGSSPPGWYRLGATSTCTGQITIKEIVIDSYNSKESACEC